MVHIYYESFFQHTTPNFNGNGIEKKESIKQEYVKTFCDNINLGSRKVKAVIDCGNGTGSIIIKDIFNCFMY